MCVVHVEWLKESCRRYCRVAEVEFPLPGVEAASQKRSLLAARENKRPRLAAASPDDGVSGFGSDRNGGGIRVATGVSSVVECVGVPQSAEGARDADDSESSSGDEDLMVRE